MKKMVEIQTDLVGCVVKVREELSYRDDLPDPNEHLVVRGVFLDEDREPCFLIHNLDTGEIRNMYPFAIHFVSEDRGEK